MVGVLTILWSELERDELDLVRIVAARYENAVDDSVVVRRMVSTASGTLLSAIDHGGVVLIAVGGREASMGLSLGVDEVLRAGELTESSIDDAIQGALARAEGRAHRKAQVRARDARTFSLLAAALGNELGASLSIASTCCEVLSSGLPTRLSASDELLNWAVTVAPSAHARQLVAVCAASPSASELSITAVDAKDSVARALSIVKTLRELSFDGGQHYVAVDQLLEELVEMLRAYVGAWAELRLEAGADAHAGMSRSNLTWILATLIAIAVEALRGGADAGSIAVRSNCYDGCVVIEVEHEGASSDSDVASGELVSLREQTRHVGGELVLEASPDSMIYRLILPSVDAPAAGSGLRPAGWDHVNELDS